MNPTDTNADANVPPISEAASTVEAALPVPDAPKKPPESREREAWGGVVWVTPAHPEGVFRER